MNMRVAGDPEELTIATIRLMNDNLIHLEYTEYKREDGMYVFADARYVSEGRMFRGSMCYNQNGADTDEVHVNQEDVKRIAFKTRICYVVAPDTYLV